VGAFPARYIFVMFACGFVMTRPLGRAAGVKPTSAPDHLRDRAMFATTITGSLPKPAWLAEPNRLWAPWRPAGAELEAAKRDATILALKLQEDCGIDIVSDGEQSRQHFVHAFLESVAGVEPILGAS
jgi:hypothetical protein